MQVKTPTKILKEFSKRFKIIARKGTKKKVQKKEE